MIWEDTRLQDMWISGLRTKMSVIKVKMKRYSKFGYHNYIAVLHNILSSISNALKLIYSTRISPQQRPARPSQAP
jgi:hypothetical protein